MCWPDPAFLDATVHQPNPVCWIQLQRAPTCQARALFGLEDSPLIQKLDSRVAAMLLLLPHHQISRTVRSPLGKMILPEDEYHLSSLLVSQEEESSQHDPQKGFLSFFGMKSSYLVVLVRIHSEAFYVRKTLFGIGPCPHT